MESNYHKVELQITKRRHKEFKRGVKSDVGYLRTALKNKDEEITALLHLIARKDQQRTRMDHLMPDQIAAIQLRNLVVAAQRHAVLNMPEMNRDLEQRLKETREAYHLAIKMIAKITADGKNEDTNDAKLAQI